MKKINGVMKRSVFSSPRRGSTFPVAIVVMLLFMILCVGMLGLSRMDVSHVVFFERRNVLEQATLSLAETLAGEIANNGSVWWAADPAALGKGELNVDSGTGPGIPKMKFTYEATCKGSNAYTLFVRGEYAVKHSESLNDAIWGVSLDISSTSGKPLVRWSQPLQLEE